MNVSPLKWQIVSLEDYMENPPDGMGGWETDQKTSEPWGGSRVTREI